jgi:hypothetical protein
VHGEIVIMKRPFQVLGIQQIAIGGTDKQRLKKLWVDMFGLEVTGTYKSERENVDEDICVIGAGAFKVEVDLMQPLDIDQKPAVHTRACALHPAASARARPALTSAFSIPRATKPFRSGAKAC